jgi:hypothetical protein
MTDRATILTELEMISSLLASVPFVNVYKVDTDYFDGLRAELQARITADSFTSESNNMQIPTGYFDTLSTNVLQKIKAIEHNEVIQELESISSLVASIGNENVYQVPQGYFEQIQFKNTNEAKVVKLNPLRKIFKYAAAAVIVGLLGIGVFKFIDNNNVKPDAASIAVFNEANKIIKEGSFEKELENIPDKDLEKYLSDNGVDVAAGLVASTIDDESKLPEVDDYLFDDNTLNEFLKNNNINN